MNLCCFRDSAETFFFFLKFEPSQRLREKTCLVFWLVTKSRYLHCEANKIAFLAENNQSQHPDTGLEQPELWRGLGGLFFSSMRFQIWYLLQCGKMWWRYPEWIRFSWACHLPLKYWSCHAFLMGRQVIWTSFQDEFREFPAVTVNDKATRSLANMAKWLKHKVPFNNPKVGDVVFTKYIGCTT